MTVAFDDAAPRFQKVVFPDGFTPHRLTDSVAVGVVTDSVELQRVAVVRLATVPPEPYAHSRCEWTWPLWDGSWERRATEPRPPSIDA